LTAVGSNSLLNVTVPNFVVPNLIGTNGINGTNGVNGTNGLDFNSTGNIFLYNGTQGIQGVPGESITGPTGPVSPLVYVGVAISLFALAVAFWEKRGEKSE